MSIDGPLAQRNGTQKRFQLGFPHIPGNGNESLHPLSSHWGKKAVLTR